MDEFCGNCGARLAEGVEWCTQCYAPIARPEAAPTPATQTAGATPAAPTGMPPIGGVLPTDGQQAPGAERTFADPRTGKSPDIDQKYYETPEFSRWRKGPDSFGPVGRSIMSIILIAVLVGLFTVVHAAIFAFTGFLVPANQLRLLYAVVAVPVALWGLSKIWKRSRFK